ncbi:glycosyltransferase [bacterium]|nr:glycosyltransferase [bacterium]
MIIGPVAWGGVWGHGPELARHLALSRPVEYLDPPRPPGECAPSFQPGEAYPLPAGVRVTRRRSRFRPGLLYGLGLEWANLCAAVRSRAASLVTYYALGSVLALAWFRLRGRRSLFVYADFPDILRSAAARFLFRVLGLRLSTALATAGSLATSRLLYEDLGRLTGRRHFVPNGVRLDEIPDIRMGKEPGAEFTVGFVGFFGHWVHLESVAAAARLCPQVRFELVGEGPARARLHEEDIPENMVFLGRLPHDEVFHRIAGWDLGLVPFRVNALTDRVSPVKLFEYWALGCPVLASPCRELALAAESSPAALVLYRDPDSLAAAVRAFREDPARLAAASAEARQAVKQYDWKELGRKIQALID